MLLCAEVSTFEERVERLRADREQASAELAAQQAAEAARATDQARLEAEESRAACAELWASVRSAHSRLRANPPDVWLLPKEDADLYSQRIGPALNMGNRVLRDLRVRHLGRFARARAIGGWSSSWHTSYFTVELPDYGGEGTTVSTRKSSTIHVVGSDGNMYHNITIRGGVTDLERKVLGRVSVEFSEIPIQLGRIPRARTQQLEDVLADIVVRHTAS